MSDRDRHLLNDADVRYSDRIAKTALGTAGAEGFKPCIYDAPPLHSADMRAVSERILDRLHDNPHNGIYWRHFADAIIQTDYFETKTLLAQWRHEFQRGIEAGASPRDLSYALRASYMWSGRHNFDDYMLACEWERQKSAKFWAPRRDVLEGKHRIASRIQKFIDDPDARYLGFSMPPGTGKSTLIKFLLAYVVGRWPNGMNMYVSYSDGMVKLMLDAERSILTDVHEYKHCEIFAGNCAPDISSEYKTISYRNRGDFPTLGLVAMGGSVTGRTRANRFLVTDDLVKNKEQARSPERLDKLWEDYNATLTTRMVGKIVKQIQLGTIWSVHDPISRMRAIHEGDPAYTFITIPVWDENERSNFEYNHPDNYTHAKIAEIRKSLDPADFSCLYMQQGMEKEGLAFSADQLQYYNGILPQMEPDNVIFFIDVAWGGGDSLSMPICYVYGDEMYIHDVVFDRGHKDVTLPRCCDAAIRHKARAGRVEANNGGDMYADELGRMLKENNYSMNLSTKKAPTNMSKLSRIEQHAPMIRRMYFLDEQHRTEDYRRFMNEVCAFSFTAKNVHDDAPDSLAGLCDFWAHGVAARIEAIKRLF